MVWGLCEDEAEGKGAQVFGGGKGVCEGEDGGGVGEEGTSEEVLNRQSMRLSQHKRQSETVFCGEYKAPHKLTVEYLPAGLRPMDLREKMVQRLTTPQELEQKLNCIYAS